jgi:ABC-2 type transport system permease protein
MSAILAIAIKDLKLLARDRSGFFWVLLFPLLIALFFGSVFAGGSSRAPMPIAVVDRDGSPFSRAMAAELSKSEALSIHPMSLDSARTAVRQGHLTAYVLFPKGSGQTLGFGSSNDSASIEMGLDPSRRAEAGYLKGLVTQALFASLMGSFTTEGPGRDAVRERITSIESDTTITAARRGELTSFYRDLDKFLGSLDRVDSLAPADSGARARNAGPRILTRDMTAEEAEPRTAFEVTFPSGVMWALIGVCMSFAIGIVHERLTGTFLRLRLAPISRTQVLLGKALAAFLASMGATGLLLTFASLVLGVRIMNPLALVVALAASAFCFVGLMMVISTLGRTHQAVSGAGWAILLVMSMTGGGMIPLIAMPSWMVAVSHFSLVKWGVLAIEGAIWRGFSWGEMALPLGILVTVGAVGLAVGARRLEQAQS